MRTEIRDEAEQSPDQYDIIGAQDGCGSDLLRRYQYGVFPVEVRLRYFAGERFQFAFQNGRPGCLNETDAAENRGHDDVEVKRHCPIGSLGKTEILSFCLITIDLWDDQ